MDRLAYMSCGSFGLGLVVVTAPHLAIEVAKIAMTGDVSKNTRRPYCRRSSKCYCPYIGHLHSQDLLSYYHQTLYALTLALEMVQNCQYWR